MVKSNTLFFWQHSSVSGGNPLDCFKLYDIRGLVPEQLNNTIAYNVGSALVEETKGKVFVVGQDVRESSPELSDALCRGIVSCGANVIDIGLCGTEEVYFATSHYGSDGGVMITASHNPKGYNGMKLVGKNAKPIYNETGLRGIHLRLKTARVNEAVVSKGSIEKRYDKSSYIECLANYIDARNLKPLKILADPGNGSAGVILDKLAPHLPFKWVTINAKPDGSFPHGVPNPMLAENRLRTQAAVIENQCDLGIAWDGDFDRCFFFDHNGVFIESYYIMGLLIKKLLAKEPKGSCVVYEPRLIWNTLEAISNVGGEPVISQTGHAFMKDKMRKVDAVYGGEMSAHHYFRDFNYCDSGMIPWLLVAELISQTGMTLAQLINSCMNLHPCSGELNYKVADAAKVSERVLDYYMPFNPKIDKTDGLSLEFSDWRFNLRSSNTEPLLRLNVEARKNKEIIVKRIKEIEQIIKSEAS